jgi:hypothetical protein
MAATPCEGERRKGASPMDGARGPLNMDVNWPGPPFVVRQAVGVAQAKSGDEYLCVQTYELLLFAGESRLYIIFGQFAII